MESQQDVKVLQDNADSLLACLDDGQGGNIKAMGSVDDVLSNQSPLDDVTAPPTEAHFSLFSPGFVPAEGESCSRREQSRPQLWSTLIFFASALKSGKRSVITGDRTAGYLLDLSHVPGCT